MSGHTNTPLVSERPEVDLFDPFEDRLREKPDHFAHRVETTDVMPDTPLQTDHT